MSIGLGINLAIKGGSASGIAVPSFVDSSRLMILPHALVSVRQESGSQSTPETYVTASGQSVGQIDDLSPCGNEVVTTTAGRPTFGTSALKNAYITLGSGKFMWANNSKKSYSTIWGTGRAGAIAMWILCGSDGANEQLLDQLGGGGTTASAGVWLRRTSANKLQLVVAKASAGNAVFSYTSTTTSVTVSNSWMAVIINFNGDGTGNLYVTKYDGTVIANGEAITAVNAGANVDATTDLFIGSTTTPDTNWTGSIGPVVILPTSMSAAQRTEFLNYNPALSNAPLARKIASNSLPTDYSNLRMWLDGAGTTYFYQGQNRTTAVSAENDPVRTWACRAPLNVNRDMDGSGAAGTYPLYKPSGAGGVGGIDFDGSNDNLVFKGVWPRAGNWHAFIVAKNDDQTDGSHFWSMASGYLALTGANYGSPNPGSTNPYAVNHCNNGEAVAEFAAAPNSGGFNVHEVKRDGQTLSIRTNGRAWVSVTLSSGAGNYYSAMGNIGHANANWQLDGMVCEFVLYTVPLPDSYANAVASQLGTKWSVANMSV